MCPRTYTKTFAKRAAFLYPAMIKKTLPPPQKGLEDEFSRLWACSSDVDAWDDAFMNEVARYLLGAKGLNVPSSWEWIIPKSI